MKRESINYFAVGLFVLAALAVLLFVLFHLVSGTGERDSYYTYYRNVSGLTRGTPVTYEGYAFGHVSAIRPERGAQGIRYRVELKVSKGWQIPSDSIARIYSEGLLADTVVNIDEGTSTQYLSPGDALEGEQGVDLFAAIGEAAGDFSDLSEHAIRPMLETLNRTVQQVGGDLESRLPPIMDGMQNLITKLDKSATHLSGMLNEETEMQARRILNNADMVAADFRTLSQGLVDVKKDTQRLIRKLDGLVTHSQPDIENAVADLRHVLEQVSRYSQTILHNLDSSSRNLSEFSRQIRENPGRLLGGGAPPSDEGVRRD